MSKADNCSFAPPQQLGQRDHVALLDPPLSPARGWAHFTDLRGCHSFFFPVTQEAGLVLLLLHDPLDFLVGQIILAPTFHRALMEPSSGSCLDPDILADTVIHNELVCRLVTVFPVSGLTSTRTTNHPHDNIPQCFNSKNSSHRFVSSGIIALLLGAKLRKEALF